LDLRRSLSRKHHDITFPFKKYEWKEGRKVGGIQGSNCTSRKEENFGATALQRVYNSVAIKSWYPIRFSFGSEACLLLCFKKHLKIKILVSTLWLAPTMVGPGRGEKREPKSHSVPIYCPH